MNNGTDKTGQPKLEVAMVDPELVRVIFDLLKLKWGCKRIASELGVARNTVRRYQRLGQTGLAGPITRKVPDKLAGLRQQAQGLFAQEAEGNAVVVQRLLAAKGAVQSLRTVQRLVLPARRAQRQAQVATTRFETAPGKQMQIDFGQKRVMLGLALARVYLFVAVLGYSRRIFVQAGLSERQEDWQEGIRAAFAHFGGTTATLLIDNPKAMVLSHDQKGGQVQLHPVFAGFCKDLGTEPRACRPYRARTKGKVEAGVKYVKRNALAGLSFVSMAALQSHLQAWMKTADERVHGTMGQRPIDLFTQSEAQALGPLSAQPVPARTRELQRKVSADALVDIDSVRYSVPARLVGERVLVRVGDTVVRVYAGAICVAEHRRCFEPKKRVEQREHYKDLWRSPEASPPGAAAADEGLAEPPDESLTSMGRSLQDYAQVLGGEQ